jgi:hypothetical protein
MGFHANTPSGGKVVNRSGECHAVDESFDVRFWLRLLKNSDLGQRENLLDLNLQGKARTRGRVISPTRC